MSNNLSEFRSHSPDAEHILSQPASSGSNFQTDKDFIQALENSIPSGIAVIDEYGTQVYVNQSFCRLVGWDKAELLGKKPPFVYWSDDDIYNINNAFRQTLENKAPQAGFDLVFCNRNKEKINVNVIVSSFKMQSDRTFFLANVCDITDRKRTEEELTRSRLFLLSSLESQQETIIFLTDRNYNYLYFNKAHAESMKFAYDADIKQGCSFIDYISSDDDRKLIKEYLDLTLADQSASFIQTFGDTNKAYYECSVNPIKNEQNEVIGSTVLARNITERIQAEKARKESETKFKEIIDQINDAILVFDNKGQIIIWNMGAERICGVKREDALTKNVIDVQLQLTPPPYNKREIIEKAITGMLTLKTPERFNQIIDSEIITWNSSDRKQIQSMVFPVKLNEAYLFCSVIRDVTELKRYEKELLRVNQEKDRIYSMIAQYLYTPFNVFNNFSKLMAEELDNLPIKEIQKMARMMSKSASNLYDLLDNLLQWTKTNQGKITFEPQLLNLKTTILESVTTIKYGNKMNANNVNYFIEDEITAYADKFMLKTVFTNILSYIINRSKSGSINDVFVNKSNSEIEISVRNETSKLNHENINEIFTSASIASDKATIDEGGTTLSLLLCRDLVEKHGGRIWAESQNGSCNEIRFVLPERK
ncbi:MAG: PAS domain S-box protein [Bacteroidales bacterium]|jgi:PAS domain S-box-containing protein|nr:PAS domain S-box protein [Bacteroidales bacterium]